MSAPAKPGSHAGKEWLDYTGKSTRELLDHKSSHRIDSLLCAFEQGIQRKRTHTDAEELVLAVMALQREVNNGGFDQFLDNASGQYAPGIASQLRRIGCEETARIAEKALAAKRRDAWDKKFFALTEIEPKLWSFIEANAARIRLRRVSLPTPPKPSPIGFTGASTVLSYLQSTREPTRTVAGVRRLAKLLVRKHSLAVKPPDIEGGVALYLFWRFVREENLRGAKRLAPRAFRLGCRNTSHGIYHMDWVTLLLKMSRIAEAEQATLQYLKFLGRLDQALLWTNNMAAFWWDFIQPQVEALPRATRYFRKKWPQPPVRKFGSS